MSEEWRVIPGVEDYEASNCGQIRRVSSGRILRPIRGGFGYRTVHITGRHIMVHRLVAKAYIPNKNQFPQVNHIDGDKANNRVENLEWCTGSENVLHAFRIGLRRPTSGESHGMAVLTERQVAEIRNAPIVRGIGVRLSKKYGVSQAMVSRIRSGKSWSHMGVRRESE